MATVGPVPSDIVYPESDGELFGETPIHRDGMFDLIDMLQWYYVADPNVYVSGGMMMYYVEGNPDSSVSPDVFVTSGIPELPERLTYQIWLEGKGPDIVIELTSTSTLRFDLGRKFSLYRDVLKVPEYFLFDPLEELPSGKFLCGYRLVKGEYELIPETDGRLVSEVSGLHLEAAGEHLRLYDPRHGVYLLRLQEVREVLKRESAAREAADAKAQQAAAARVAAGAEVERLRREIEELRRAKPPGS